MEQVFDCRGYRIDLKQLYREMYDQSVLEDGHRLFKGNARDVRAVKRLIHDLFSVPVEDKMHPDNHAVRSECRDRLEALGWATKHRGRSATYTLYREL
jgi:hypothetical protein